MSHKGISHKLLLEKNTIKCPWIILSTPSNKKKGVEAFIKKNMQMKNNDTKCWKTNSRLMLEIQVSFG